MSPDLEATFDARWRTLALAHTQVAPGATIRPVASTGGGQEPGTAPQLPHISLGQPASRNIDPPSRTGLHDLEVVSTLGEGGMGRVQLARQRSLDRDVAIKTLKPGAPGSARAGLLAEATITGSLEHPAIIPVHALGVDDDGHPVLVMKRVEGVEWRKLVYDDDHPAWADVAPDGGDHLAAHLEILGQVCNALEFAHSRGIVHRDIKPENVMVGRFGEVYLVDWGIATEAGPSDGKLAGSPGYMAPEMVAAEPVDPTTDVYLLGATLHEILVRGMRHQGDTLQQVLLAAFVSRPVTYEDTVPQELAGLANRATMRDPTNRVQSALEFRHALDDFERHRSSIALGRSAAERLGELQALLPEGDRAPGDSVRAHRLATESRFGFSQALEQWADNPGARRGLEDCIAAGIDLELREGNVAGARALMAELPAGNPALEARLGELERKLEDQRAEGERLRRIEHDLDTSVGARSRVRALIGLALAGSCVSAFALHKGVKNVHMYTLVEFSTVVAAGCFLVLLLFHKPLMKNAFNRRVMGMGIVAVVALVCDRLVSLRVGMSVTQTIGHDLFVLCALSTAGAVMLARVLAVTAALFGAGLVVLLVMPVQAPIVFSITGLVAILVTAVVWRPSRDVV